MRLCSSSLKYLEEKFVVITAKDKWFHFKCPECEDSDESFAWHFLQICLKSLINTCSFQFLKWFVFLRVQSPTCNVLFNISRKFNFVSCVEFTFYSFFKTCWTLFETHVPKWADFNTHILKLKNASVTVYLWVTKNKKFWEEIIAYYDLIRHGPHKKRRVQQFCCCVCIRCRGNVFTDPLPSNNTGIHIQTHWLMGGTSIYEARRWNGLRCRDIHIKFYKDWFRRSKVDMVGYIDRPTEWWYRRTFIFLTYIPILKK
jgi:hypothetical protein